MSINVTSVEPAQRINPGRIGSVGRLDQTSAAQGHGPVRRLTRLDADYYATVQRGPTRGGPSGRSSRHVAASAGVQSDGAWLRMVERAVGGWAPTLRQSVALVALWPASTEGKFAFLLVLRFLFGMLQAGGSLLHVMD